MEETEQPVNEFQSDHLAVLNEVTETLSEILFVQSNDECGNSSRKEGTVCDSVQEIESSYELLVDGTSQ